jgi:hypothetical protein
MRPKHSQSDTTRPKKKHEGELMAFTAEQARRYRIEHPERVRVVRSRYSKKLKAAGLTTGTPGGLKIRPRKKRSH